MDGCGGTRVERMATLNAAVAITRGYITEAATLILGWRECLALLPKAG